jgi:sodium transport system permease protein
MVVVLPLLLYPGLSVLMLQMGNLFNQQAREVVILGTDSLPDLPLIDNGSFSSRWFRKAETAKKLHVITDYEPSKDSASSVDTDKNSQQKNASHKSITEAHRAELLEAANKIHELVKKRNVLVNQLAKYDAKLVDELPGVQAAAIRSSWKDSKPPEKPPEILEIEKEYRKLKNELGEAFGASKLQVLLIIPDGFGETLKQINAILSARPIATDALAKLKFMRPIIVRNRANDKSDVAYSRVREALDKWEKQILKDRLDAAELPESIVDPVSLHSIDIASQEEIAASVWSKIFPALVVIMALTGAFYPAIDIAAGEKERGTMETLLICPATRSEIVMGKFFTVLLFSMTTTILNLISMGFTSQIIISGASQGAAFGSAFEVPLPTPLALVWLIVLLIPLAAFFSALCLALSTFARSNKEGQYYLTPLFMVAMGMTMFSMSPSIELSQDNSMSLFYCAMPIFGPALLLKALLMNPNNTDVLVFGLPVLMSSIGYGLIALWWAVEQFKSESVLFRADERFDLKLWVKHLFRDKEPTPSFAQSMTCFIMMMMLQFLSISFLSGAFKGIAPEEFGRRIMEVAIASQIALIAAPALFMAILLTSNFRETLRLKKSAWSFVGAAILLPVVMHPLAMELLDALSDYFPQLPETAKAAFAAMGDEDLPIWLIIGAFALTPAICEEIAFRGFILSGFGQKGRYGIAIIMSSVTFGIVHMIPQQVFNASLLGLVLGLLAIRSGSLIPGIVFHFCFNSLAVLHSKVTSAWQDAPPDMTGATGWFFKFNEGGQIGYTIPTLVICAAISFATIRWLLRYGRPASVVVAENGQAKLGMDSPQRTV